jgi:PAS domain S-box-containing protein
VSFQINLDRFCQTLAREARDAVIYADAEGFIRFWNRGAERIFRFEEAEAIGKSLDIVIPENLRKRHWDGYTETMRTGKTPGTAQATSLRCRRSARMGHAFRSSSPSSRSATRPVAWSGLRQSCAMSPSDLRR